MDSSSLSSNWKKLQATLHENKVPVSKSDRRSPQIGTKRKRLSHTGRGSTGSSIAKSLAATPSRKRVKLRSGMSDVKTQALEQGDGDAPVKNGAGTQREVRVHGGLDSSVELGKYVALDCEMVGVGPFPHLESALARVSIVNYRGDCVYDSYVKPLETVTDWRTHVSGIEPKHMYHARTLEEVQRDVAAIIKDRTVIGHSLRGDWDALMLSHPRPDVRDTAKHPPHRKLAGGGSPKLKILASELLGLEIQTGEHSSIEDARATMLLYRRDKDAFEREHARKWPVRVVPVKTTDAETESSQKKTKSKKKKKKKK